MSRKIMSVARWTYSSTRKLRLLKGGREEERKGRREEGKDGRRKS